MRNYFFILVLILIFFFPQKDCIFSQIREDGEKLPLKFGSITFNTRETESKPSEIKFLEIYIELLNTSRKKTIPANSTRIVLEPKEIKFLDHSNEISWLINKEEKIIDFPLPPLSGRVVVFGILLPQKKLQSISFEIQFNPPYGEKRLIIWEEK